MLLKVLFLAVTSGHCITLFSVSAECKPTIKQYFWLPQKFPIQYIWKWMNDGRMNWNGWTNIINNLKNDWFRFRRLVMYICVVTTLYHLLSASPSPITGNKFQKDLSILDLFWKLSIKLNWIIIYSFVCLFTKNHLWKYIYHFAGIVIAVLDFGIRPSVRSGCVFNLCCVNVVRVGKIETRRKRKKENEIEFKTYDLHWYFRYFRSIPQFVGSLSPNDANSANNHWTLN